MTLLSSKTTEVKAAAPVKVLMSPAMIFMIEFDPRRSMIKRWAGRPSGKFLPAFSTPNNPFITGSPLRLMISAVWQGLTKSDLKDLAGWWTFLASVKTQKPVSCQRRSCHKSSLDLGLGWRVEIGQSWPVHHNFTMVGDVCVLGTPLPPPESLESIM